MPSKAKPAWVILIPAAVLLASGSYDSLAVKLMNRQKIAPCEGCEPRNFEAPFFQTLVMFFGQLLVLPLYYIYRRVKSRKTRDYGDGRADRSETESVMSHQSGLLSEGPTMPCPKYLWMIPAIIDLAATAMINYASVLAKVSTVQMLRNFNVVVTAVLSVVYLRVGLKVFQILSVLILTSGLIVTGINAFLVPEEQTNHDGLEWLAILLALAGTLLSSFQFVYEEGLFRRYAVTSFEGVGWMGLFGLIASQFILFICELTPKLEKTSETLYMMSHGGSKSTTLIIANVTFIFSISLFNTSGLTITKMASGLLRVILIATRTVTIWLLELALQWDKFSGLKLGGLILILVGVLLYHYDWFGAPGCCPGDKCLRVSLGGASKAKNQEAESNLDA